MILSFMFGFLFGSLLVAVAYNWKKPSNMIIPLAAYWLPGVGEVIVTGLNDDLVFCVENKPGLDLEKLSTEEVEAREFTVPRNTFSSTATVSSSKVIASAGL